MLLNATNAILFLSNIYFDPHNNCCIPIFKVETGDFPPEHFHLVLELTLLLQRQRDCFLFPQGSNYNNTGQKLKFNH